MTTTLLSGDCRELLPTLPAHSVQAIITSPPYWRMRQYTDDPRELGQEDTPAAYVAALAAVFAACWRVLRDDGTLWLNLGDAYANDSKWGGATGGKATAGLHGAGGPGRRKVATGLPAKSLIGLPWRVAFALQDAGWVLRNDIIWHKPNVMPESVMDRCSMAHEYLFLFSKSDRYYFNKDAIREPYAEASLSRYKYDFKAYGKDHPYAQKHGAIRDGGKISASPQGRGARTVWTIPTSSIPDAHYAPMPEALARRCILAGSRPGDTVLDPFAGSGTTLRAAVSLERHAVGIDLGYAELQARRLDGVQIAMTALETTP